MPSEKNASAEGVRAPNLRGNKLLLLTTVIVGLAGPALAISTKPIMQHMADTTGSAKAVLDQFALAQAQAVLRAYAEESRAADALYSGQKGGKAQDLHQRFARLSATADAASRSVTDRAGFRAAFREIVGQCRSCHSSYR
jgi:cytochrome c556